MYRVFVVDDENEIRRGIVNFFPWEMLGFRVAGQAENGKQALDYLLKNAGSVDVLLTDIKMPVMDGIELVRCLREAGLNLKVVLLSAYSDFEYARDGLKLGVVDYALKPTEYKNLIKTFERIRGLLDMERNMADSKPVASEPLHYRGRIIQTVKQFLNLHYDTTNLEETARFVNLSPSYLSTLFKEEAGISYSDYLLGLKMENAARMVLDIGSKTYEISEKIGYRSAKNFARAFKKYYGVSPREYRDSPGRADSNET